MRLAKTAIVAVAVLALGALPGKALAGGQNAAIEEYVLDIPSAGGNDHRGGSGGDPSSSSAPAAASPLSPAAESALRAQGTDGEAAADLANSRGGDRRGSGGSSGLASPGGAAQSEEGPGLAELVAGVAGGSDSGMGPALPIILILALVGTAALWLRRRGDKSPDA